MKPAALALFCFINVPYFIKLGGLSGDLLLPAAAAWAVFAIVVFLFYERAAGLVRAEAAWKIAALLLILSVVAASIFIFVRKDPETLAVDRWSSTRAFWDMFFSGRFPYLGRSHLGNPISGLPFLEMALLPFYFAGELGLATVAAFMALAGLAWRLTGDPRRVVVMGLIFFGSPAFWFEVTTRSDLVVNAGLVILAVWFFSRAVARSTPGPGGTAAEPGRDVLAAALLVGLTLCTRTVVAIPLLVLAPIVVRTYSFRGSVAVGLAGVAGLLLPFAILLPWDPTLLATHNPLAPQLSKGNPLVTLVSAAAALFLGSRVREFRGWIGRSLAALALLFGLTLLFSLARYGYSETILGNQFDVSYLNLMLPFLALGVSLTPRPSRR